MSAKKNVDKKTTEKKAVVKKTDEVANEKSLEGLTKMTVESGVISFKEGSGSQDLLNLLVTIGWDREAVIAAANKLKAAGKGFLKCNPVAKYNKVAGIVKNLQRNGYKIPSA